MWLSEVRANLFAAELLMPIDEIRARLREMGRLRLPLPATDLVRLLSKHFGVSQKAMSIRLADLGVNEIAGQELRFS